MHNTEINRIEYKQQLTDDFEQEVIAFLNYKEGGIIYIGIDNNGQAIEVDNIDLMQLQVLYKSFIRKRLTATYNTRTTKE